MAIDRPLKILLVAAEAVPFAKAGGVADVIGSLPKELTEMGHDVRIFIPRHGIIPWCRNDAEPHWELRPTGVKRMVYLEGRTESVEILETRLPGTPEVTVYLLEHERLFGRQSDIYLGLDHRDEQRRFLLFCRGVLESLPDLGFEPDIIHLNDWQAAPCAAYLRTSHRHLLRQGRTRIVYTVHNLQYQGRWDPSILRDAGLDPAHVFTPSGLEFWGDVNWMKGGIVYADAITTVSPSYAEEIQTLEFGCGLDEVLSQRSPRLFGILNGIDQEKWNPEDDSHIAEPYTATTASAGKAHNRAALLEDKNIRLRDTPGWPVVGIVSRLADQKGFDLIAGIADTLPNLPLQLVVLGDAPRGQRHYEELFQKLFDTTPNVRGKIGFDEPLSHRIYAGSDFLLMPSAFEPCGLAQLIALRYGTLPIVHATGGLADTVTDLDADPAGGNGICFTDYSTTALLDALQRALRAYKDHKSWPGFVARAMGFDSRWSSSACAYSKLYRRVLKLPPM
jgi:starch synthase